MNDEQFLILGGVDAGGRLRLERRATEMIISGGYNVYPKEIEMVLDEVPGVVETAVIGVPHPEFGEVAVAIVVCEPGATVSPDDLDEALTDVLALFKAPQALRVRRVTPAQHHFEGAEGGPTGGERRTLR